MPVVTAEQLLTENPEIFEVKPRPGGVLNVEEIKQPCKSKDDDSKKKNKNVSRQYRINEVLKSRMSGMEDDLSAMTSAELTKNSMDMLAVTVSCIMLMASGAGDISREHYLWANTYLKCIVNEFGQYPPNVQGILNHIQLSGVLGGDGADGGEGGEGGEGGDKTIRTTTTVTPG